VLDLRGQLLRAALGFHDFQRRMRGGKLAERWSLFDHISILKPRLVITLNGRRGIPVFDTDRAWWLGRLTERETR